MSKPHYSLASNTDDDDVESPPPTVYRDDPERESSDETHKRDRDENDIPTNRYTDDPSGSVEGSIFDWGCSAGNTDQTMDAASNRMSSASGDIQGEVKKMNVSSSSQRKRIDDVSFEPISLDGDDSEEEYDIQETRHRSGARMRNKDHDQYLHVGGGWGRHGSTKSNMCYPLYRLCNRLTIVTLGFGLMVLAFGMMGYEAGQPADTQGSGIGENEGKTPTTKGEEWLEWIEHPKDHIHWPHIQHHSNNLDKDGIHDNNIPFQPQSQAQLLQTSQNVFHSCNEHSLSTSAGRSACITACHGRICCFEKDPDFGSCVDDAYSYCFAYAACENLLQDFSMNNVVESGTGNESTNGGRLNEQDKNLLRSACSNDNVLRLEGIRDCNAFCMHHLCCFNGDGCGIENSDEGGICDDYDACKVLVKDGNSEASEVSGATNNFSGSMMRPASSNIANGHDFSFHDPEAIRSSVSSVCTFDPLSNDESWVAPCHDLCADYLCCFGTPGTVSDCREEKHSMCNAYSGCNVLLYQTKDIDHEQIKGKYVAHRPEMDGKSSIIPDDIREVNEACNANVLQNPTLRSRCEVACSSRKCCFMNGPGNCYILDTAWCDEYQACQILSD
eukprot:CCRYP_007165-RA/>CCRYP_007165-RA protein AED:0.01 eAED:0.01 QI:122/1/1/1/1/1/2/1809/612